MPALVRDPDALGTKLVTVFAGNHARGLPSHLASILLLDPETGALRALLDGRFITEARTGAVSAVSSRLPARKTASSIAILGARGCSSIHAPPPSSNRETSCLAFRKGDSARSTSSPRLASSSTARPAAAATPR